MFTMIHENYNVRDLDRSLAFYREALGLHEVRRNEKPEFTIVFMADDTETFQLELTWLKDRTQPYDLGEQEFHLALLTDRFDELLARHRAMGCVCFENPAMGIYFIEDPDGYWIEIVPEHS